jgi:ABC-type Fe3+-hydroxamate transport system substrate-binding protein
VLKRDPDVILALGPDPKAAAEWAADWRAYPTLKAVRTARIIPWTDQRLSRLGPSMVAATAALCSALEH